MLILMASLVLAAAVGYNYKKCSHKGEADRNGALLLLIMAALAVAVSALRLVPEAQVAVYAAHGAALAGVVFGWLGLRYVKRMLRSIPAADEPIPAMD